MDRTMTASADVPAFFARAAAPHVALVRDAPVGEAVACVLDPLDDDREGDAVVVTTRRGICRVALVASETADRFRRDGLTYDPMSWMLAPRTLFHGMSALDACLERDACMRGVLMHGLSLGLDMRPEELDALTEDEEGWDEHADGEGAEPYGLRMEPREGRAGDGERVQAAAERLFTATVVAADGFETVQAFHASLAVDEAEIAGRLYMRMGAAAADAVIVDGVNPREPRAPLVAPAILDTLALIAADPGSPLAAGLDVNVEQRFLG